MPFHEFVLNMLLIATVALACQPENICNDAQDLIDAVSGCRNESCASNTIQTWNVSRLEQFYVGTEGSFIVPFFWFEHNLNLTGWKDQIGNASLRRLFYEYKGKRVEGINEWDTSNVENMTEMFYKATSFNQTLNFNTSNVKDMTKMFFDATSFNQPLNFETGNVRSMDSMFAGATSFNQSLDFSTGNVRSMDSMFAVARSFNQPLNFSTGNVRSMDSMFAGATSFNQSLDFETENVLYMSGMFAGATSFNQPLNFETGNVESMALMFSGATSFNQPLNFKTGNVDNMFLMFWNATSFNQPLNFETGNVRSMALMFSNASSFAGDLSCWNTESLDQVDGIFFGADSLRTDLSLWPEIDGQTYNLSEDYEASCRPGATVTDCSYQSECGAGRGSNNGVSSSSDINTALIIGLSIGGLLLLVILAYFFSRSRRNTEVSTEMSFL